MNIRTEFYLPFHFRYLAIGFVLISPFMYIAFKAVGIAFIVLGILGATTHYRLKVAPKMIHEFVWILGLKSGKPVMNPDVEAIYINRLNVSSGYGYVSRINVQDQYYKAFFKLRSGETIDLIEKKSQSKVLKIASEAASILNVTVYENYDAE